MDDFVKPKTVRISISGGHFIDITNRLTVGEREDTFARISVDRRELRLARVLVYLQGWSLCLDAEPVAYTKQMPEGDRVSILRGLDPDRFDEILLAIDRHESETDRQRVDEKKMLSGSQVLSATSA